MPAKGKSKVTDEQRQQIAAKKLLGQTAKAIASETGLAVKTVEKQATDPRTATFILRQRHRSEKHLEAAWELGLASILVHLKSGDSDLMIQARRDLLKFATAGDPPLMRIAAPGDREGDFTLEELFDRGEAGSAEALKSGLSRRAPSRELYRGAIGI
jgi:hypothetical protein